MGFMRCNKLKNRLWIIPLILIFILTFPLSGKGLEEELLSEIDLYEVDIRDSFRSIAELGDINILLDPIVQGKVTIKLKPGLSIKTVINHLARIHGYSYRWEQQTVIIGNDKTPASLGDEETRTYSWNNVNYNQILHAVKRLVPAERIEIDAKTNQLTVKANTLEDQNIKEIIESLDQEVTHYVIEAKITEIDLNAAKEEGLSWSLPSSSADSSFRVTSLSSLRPIALLEETKLTHVLASAQLYTDNGKQGATFIGDQYPVVISKASDNMDLIEYKQVGVGIGVTPLTKKQGLITLSLKLEVRGIDGWEKTTGGKEIPVIKSNQLTSMRSLKEGETCVIAGINLTGRALLPSNELKEGPAKKKTVCLFLTPRMVKTDQRVEREEEVASAQRLELRESGTVSLLEEQQQVTPEVIHIDIISEAKEVNSTLNLSEGELLTEVIGFNQTAKGGNSPPTQPGEEEKLLRKEHKESLPSQDRDGKHNQQLIALRVAYRVAKGDTIFSLARKYGIDPELILRENSLSSSDLLSIGKTLQIPIPQTHLYQLQPKETLWRIAQRYGTSVELLMELNSIVDVTSLRTDQVLILPVPSDQVINDKY